MTLQELIKGITAEQVGDQAFRYTPKNWTAFPRLPGMLCAAGFSQDQIDAGFMLSRREVHRVVQRLAGHHDLALVPVWGYPRGVAGSGNRKPLEAVFDNAERITRTLVECKGQRWSANRLLEAFAIAHLGLSTLSKIFYFAQIEAEEGTLLIYDQMVMRALHHHAFQEYGHWPTYGASQQDATYGRFVACTTRAARALACAPDVIEYALFREGQRLGRSAPTPAAMDGPSGLDFIEASTWGARSLFSFRVSDSGAITLRFGRQGQITIGSAQLAVLCAAFRGREVPLSTGNDNLQDWLDRHVTTVRITSYLAPVLVFLGHASRQGNRLKFPDRPTTQP